VASEHRAEADDPLRAFLPRWHYQTSAATNVDAAPERALGAVREATMAEVPLTAFLLLARAVPALLTRRLRVPDRRQRLFHLLVTTPGFIELPVPDLLVGGYTGRPWQLSGGAVQLAGADRFADFDEPGFAKVTLHFAAEATESGSRLLTETRIYLTDEPARRSFGRYWLLVRTGSNLIRRDWLRAARGRV
jgi:hypothetical protein